MHEFYVREEGVGHVLEEEGGASNEVKGYSVWTVASSSVMVLEHVETAQSWQRGGWD